MSSSISSSSSARWSALTISTRRAEASRRLVSNSCEAPASSLLGRVHRDVRVADQIGRRLRVAARERDADTAADVDLAARDAERLRERGQDATRDLLGASRRRSPAGRR